jgi:hypothetical protein
MMMNALIVDPRAWLAVIAVSILSAHALDMLIAAATRTESQNRLIPILELFVVGVLAFLAIHASYDRAIREEAPRWFEGPFGLVVVLVLFALCSVGLYLVSRRQDAESAE